MSDGTALQDGNHRFTVRRVSAIEELEGIRRLQSENLKTGMTGGQRRAQGFVTAEYPLELLARMHEAEPSVVAVAEGYVVGYVLATTRAVAGGHPLLEDLLEKADGRSLRGTAMTDLRYLLMGQVCVAEHCRGRGLFREMYMLFRSALNDRYDCCVCDIDEENLRSMAAHRAIGFESIGSLRYGGSRWEIMAWDWRDRPFTDGMGNLP